MELAYLEIIEWVVFPFDKFLGDSLVVNDTEGTESYADSVLFLSRTDKEHFITFQPLLVNVSELEVETVTVANQRGFQSLKTFRIAEPVSFNCWIR